MDRKRNKETGKRGASYISRVPTLHEEPPGAALPTSEFIALQPRIVVVVDVMHNFRLGPHNLDIFGRNTMRRIVGISAADVGNLKHHIGLLSLLRLLVPEGNADILHAIAVERGVLEPVRMNGDFTSTPRVVRDTAGALVRMIIFARCEDISVRGRAVELSRAKEFHFSMGETTKRQIDGPSSIHCGRSVSALFRLRERGGIESIGGFPGRGDGLEGRVCAWDDTSSS